jgi:hypothetical protein
VSPSRRSNGPLTPAPGVPPRSPEEVRAALLAVGRPGVPYVIRDGAPEGVDVVAGFEITKLTKEGILGRRRYCESFDIHLRLVPETHEVRAVDHYAEFTLRGDNARRRTTSRSRGQLHRTFVGYEFTPGGGERRETYRFDTDELKSALQHAVLTAGWSWHGVTFGRL